MATILWSSFEKEVLMKLVAYLLAAFSLSLTPMLVLAEPVWEKKAPVLQQTPETDDGEPACECGEDEDGECLPCPVDED